MLLPGLQLILLVLRGQTIALFHRLATYLLLAFQDLRGRFHQAYL
jgi:hypothetical protein